MKIKPVCSSCKRPFLVGEDGICQSCIKPGTRYNRLRCYCGSLAVHVVIVTVLNPDGVPRSVQLALCRDCLELERQLEFHPVKSPINDSPNPIKILIVERVPRADNPPKGRKIA
ncbi:MAG: hypothetical protein A2Z16_17290 [Chloroflexi bacterium RBG_16_54_18]|nr:MAG: hypothetical protein A2Z16_17290 [Chloroflexi bacterium RBG_16_54_18]